MLGEEGREKEREWESEEEGEEERERGRDTDREEERQSETNSTFAPPQPSPKLLNCFIVCKLWGERCHSAVCFVQAQTKLCYTCIYLNILVYLT